MKGLELKVNLLRWLLEVKNIKCKITICNGLITIESKHIELVLYTYQFMKINNVNIVKIFEHEER